MFRQPEIAYNDVTPAVSATQRAGAAKGTWAKGQSSRDSDAYRGNFPAISACSKTYFSNSKIRLGFFSTLRLEPWPWPGALTQDFAHGRWKVPQACLGLHQFSFRGGCGKSPFKSHSRQNGPVLLHAPLDSDQPSAAKSNSNRSFLVRLWRLHWSMWTNPWLAS